MAEVTYISYSARAKSTTADGIFAEAHQILDVSKNKNQQAINAEVTTELGKKVAKSDFDSFKTSNTSAIAAKADKSYVDTELGKKATKSEVSAVDAKFAGVFCNVDEVINNGGEVRVTIDTVDKKKVDIDLPVYHKSVVDTKLGTKANSADVYTKLQTDNAISAVSDNMDVLYVNLIAQSSVAVTIEGSSTTLSGGIITFGKYKTGMGSLVSEGYGFYRTIGGRHYRDMGTISQPEGYGKATTILDYKGNKYFSDGTNLYFWDGKGPLKKIVDLSTVKSDVAKKANSEDVYTKGTIDTKLAEKATTASVNSLTTRVTAVETKASTNASNITNLTSRVGAVESKFSGYVPTATYNALAARVAELEALLKLA